MSYIGRAILLVEGVLVVVVIKVYSKQSNSCSFYIKYIHTAVN